MIKIYQSLVFSNRLRLLFPKNPPILSKLQIDNSNIKRTQSIKLLRGLLDEKLQYDDHLECTVK